MGDMADEIEQRLAVAAQALREYEITERRLANLRFQTNELTRQRDELVAAHAIEMRDVERLEGLSLTRIVAALRGARDDELARERAEAEAARYRVAEAQARLEAVQRESDVARVQLARLGAAPARFAEVLDEKERHLTAS